MVGFRDKMLKSNSRLLQEMGGTARIKEAGSDIILDECIAYLRSDQAYHVEGLFLLPTSLTNVRVLQQKIFSGHGWRGPSFRDDDSDDVRIRKKRGAVVGGIPDSETEGEQHEDILEEDDDKEKEEEASEYTTTTRHGRRRTQEIVMEEEFSPYEVATLLLQHLQVRQQPLIPCDIYDRLLQCCGNGSGSTSGFIPPMRKKETRRGGGRMNDENSQPQALPREDAVLVEEEKEEDDRMGEQGDEDDDDEEEEEQQHDADNFMGVRVMILLDRLVKVLHQLPDRNRQQLEAFLTVLRRVAMEHSDDDSIHEPTLAALGSVVGPLLARPQGSVHMSIRHTRDLSKLTALGASLIQHAPDLFKAPREKGGRPLSSPSPPASSLGTTTAPAFPATPLSGSSPLIALSPVESPRNNGMHGAGLAIALSINSSSPPLSPSPSRGPSMSSPSSSPSASPYYPLYSHPSSPAHQHAVSPYHHHQQQQHQHVPPHAHSNHTGAILQQILLPNLVSKLFDAEGLSLPGTISWKCGRAMIHPQHNASIMLLQGKVDPSLSSSAPAPGGSALSLADLSLKYDDQSLSHSRASLFASLEGANGNGAYLASSAYEEGNTTSAYLATTAAASCYGARHRKRMVAACRALREQIDRFEEGFMFDHGHVPRGVERAAMASTYYQYRAWKRIIRDDAAKAIQRVFRGAMVRGHLPPAVRCRRKQKDEREEEAGEEERKNGSSHLNIHEDGEEEDDGAEEEEKPTTASSSKPSTSNCSTFTTSSSSTSLSLVSDLNYLVEKKKEVKARLKRFDAEFLARFRRPPTKEDKEPIRCHYERYNRLKNRIQALSLEKEKMDAVAAVPTAPPLTSVIANSSAATNRNGSAGGWGGNASGIGGGGGGGGGAAWGPPQQQQQQQEQQQPPSQRPSSSPSPPPSSLSSSFSSTSSAAGNRRSISNNSVSGDKVGLASTEGRAKLVHHTAVAAQPSSSSTTSSPPLPTIGTSRPFSSLTAAIEERKEDMVKRLNDRRASAFGGGGEEGGGVDGGKKEGNRWRGEEEPQQQPQQKQQQQQQHPQPKVQDEEEEGEEGEEEADAVALLQSLKAEKKVLHAHLRKFEKEFQREFGRKVSTAGDIIPVEEEYRRYKKIKVQIERIQQKKKFKPLSFGESGERGGEMKQGGID